MQRLRHADLEGVIRVAGEIAAIDDAELDPFPSYLLEWLRGLVPSDWVMYSELDRPGRRVLGGLTLPHDRFDASDEDTFWQLRHQLPTCGYQERTGDFSPHKMSDFVTLRELQRLAIYNEYLRKSDIAYWLDVGLPAPLTHTKVFIFNNRFASGDYGERERTILTLLRPHLIRRYEHVSARKRAAVALSALETTDEPLVLLGEDGRGVSATARARRLLAEHGFDLSDVPNVNPLALHNLAPGVVRLEARRPLGLTPREHEILALVSEGQTNAQVAATLCISPATVGKHLENAYAKLGVTSRTAALRLIREHTAM